MSVIQHVHDKLTSTKEEYLKSRHEWEQEKLAMRRVTAPASEVIRLNVGGLEVQTKRNTLCSVPGSKLCKFFSSDMGLDKDSVFLDRNGVAFQYVLDYLRNERKV